jgi:hypothetical protein
VIDSDNQKTVVVSLPDLACRFTRHALELPDLRAGVTTCPDSWMVRRVRLNTGENSNSL